MTEKEMILRLLLLGLGPNKDAYRKYVVIDLVNNRVIADTKTTPKPIVERLSA